VLQKEGCIIPSYRPTKMKKEEGGSWMREGKREEKKGLRTEKFLEFCGLLRKKRRLIGWSD